MMTQLPQGRGLLEEPAVRELMAGIRRTQPGLPALIGRWVLQRLRAAG